MKYLLNSLKQEDYLFRHSSLIWMHILFPVLGIVMLGLYFFGGSREQAILDFTRILSIVYPFVIGIVCAVAVSLEEESGMYHRIFTFPGNRSVPYFVKLIYLLLAGLVSLTITIMGFVFLYSKNHNEAIFIPDLIFGVRVIWLTAIPVYLIQYFLSYRFGNVFGISVGVIGTLIAALMETGLGDGIWMYSIWGAGNRILTVNSLSDKMKVYFAGEINSCILFSIVISMVFVIGLWFFSQGFEGQKEIEE
ncbi:lantibiotic immunity ABC transporter MutG family permease subunit [Gallicola sp. Sow4_E12]|uniref:lantibiotic immunity ABC transporter MutG family permease subunit n=1 Tax=Gallicola sp. Sow4_E12 TaxID=3438785 RepID=UPI003F8E6C1D